MSRKLKQHIPAILMALGLLLILTCGLYEGTRYPWQLLASRWGWSELPTELEEPSPLPAAALTPGADDGLIPASGLLPEPVGMLAPRPTMNLTKLGTIKLPKIQVSENIVEGSGNALLYAVGHVEGSAMPGQAGNCVLAGHRSYIYMRPFRHLDKMEVGDLVQVSDGELTYTYQVYQIFEALPEDSWVQALQKEESHMLTLVTCTPLLTFTHRLIVWCRMV